MIIGRHCFYKSLTLPREKFFSAIMLLLSFKQVFWKKSLLLLSSFFIHTIIVQSAIPKFDSLTRNPCALCLWNLLINFFFRLCFWFYAIFRFVTDPGFSLQMNCLKNPKPLWKHVFCNTILYVFTTVRIVFNSFYIGGTNSM